MTTEAGRRQREMDELHDALEHRARGNRCVNCHMTPDVAWINGTYLLRCNCYPKEPALTSIPNPAKERMGQMVEERGLARLEDLTEKEIQQFISPKATAAEAHFFLRFCQAQGLNPFINEVYLVKYDDRKPASIVVGFDTYLKRASRHPQYAGYRSGIVVEKDDGVIADRDGSMELPGDKLIGGWCEVTRKDWDPPTKRHTVGLKEYHKNQSTWNSHPATMIEKVAISQALRRVFPTDDAQAGLSVVTDVEIETPLEGSSGAEREALIESHAPPVVEGEKVSEEEVQEPVNPATGEIGGKAGGLGGEPRVVFTGEVEGAPGDDSEFFPDDAKGKGTTLTPAPVRSTERRFKSVTEFWDGIEAEGLEREHALTALGGSLGDYLNGPPRRTWDEAFNVVMGGKPDGHGD